MIQARIARTFFEDKKELKRIFYIIFCENEVHKRNFKFNSSKLNNINLNTLCFYPYSYLKINYLKILGREKLFVVKKS